MLTKFTIVNCSPLTFDEQFKKTNDTEIINYLDISDKLENNDINKKTPHHSIVRYYIIKKINKLITDKDEHKVIYFLDNLDIEIIRSLKKLVYSIDNIRWDLFTDLQKISPEINSEFDRIEYLEDDKTQIN